MKGSGWDNGGCWEWGRGCTVVHNQLFWEKETGMNGEPDVICGSWTCSMPVSLTVPLLLFVEMLGSHSNCSIHSYIFSLFDSVLAYVL